MCGIVGIFDLSGANPISEKTLASMNDSQRHRGPDEGNLHLEPGLGLGHRRLSIIDIANGQQPLFNEDGSVVVTYNGEIYNHRALASELQALGHVFRSQCDTEVIVHAWEQWGEACVERFRGMFAFAVWDRNQQCLFLARDRLGIKPLYYTTTDMHHFIFGSELKSLKSHGGFTEKLNPEAVEDYFSLGYIPDPKSIYKGVYKLPPGHCVRIQHGQGLIKSRAYWDISFTPLHGYTQADLEGELVERLEQAVAMRMLAEVPLGAFLSGGVDSSAVVAMMARQQQKAVNSCAIGFNVAEFNETQFAREVAEHCQTNHFEAQVDTDDFYLLDTLAAAYDEPFADSSAMPTYRVCQLAKQRVTVALSGDGGDEVFAGYRRHRWHMNEESIRSRLPAALRRPVFGALGSLYPKADWAPRIFRAKTTFQALARDSVGAYLHSVSISSETQRAALFSPQLCSDLQGYRVLDTFESVVNKAPTDDPLGLIQYIDMKTYLPGDILTKVDRASMAHALEVRVPLLDHEFVDWASGIPASLKLHRGEGKYIFKHAMEPYLPKGLLYRPKMGFAVPLARWFRGPLRERLEQSLLHGRLAASNLFDMTYLESLVQEHLRGQCEHSALLWALLMFDASLQKLGIEV